MVSDSTQKVKQVLIRFGSVTKPEVAKETGLTVATCGTILNALVKFGEVVAEDFRSSSGGRPAMSYRYNAKTALFLCLYATSENGIYSICYRIYDALGSLHDKGETKEKKINVKSLSQCVQKIIAKHSDIRIISMGIQGGVNKGVVEFCDFPELDGVDLQKELSAITKRTVLLENDMNSIALGYSQKNSDEKNVAILFVPKGNAPAGGFLVDGNLLRGSNNLAGELSYFPFPFRREEQSKVFSKIKTALPHFLQIISATITFLDPADIVFTGGFAEELSKQNIEALLKRSLNKQQLPHIVFKSDASEEYFTGLMRIASEAFLKQK